MHSFSGVFFGRFPLFKRTRKIVELSTEADDSKRRLFELLRSCVETTNNFFDGKTLALAPNKDHGFRSFKPELLRISHASSNRKMDWLDLGSLVPEWIEIAESPLRSLFDSVRGQLLEKIMHYRIPAVRMIARFERVVSQTVVITRKR